MLDKGQFTPLFWARFKPVCLRRDLPIVSADVKLSKRVKG